MKYYIVYETKNLKNGKTYIGMHETDIIPINWKKGRK
jgi:hypothetical protein